MNDADLEILLNTMNGRDRPPPFALKLLEDTCERTGLDWKARHVYLIARGGKWQVNLSIDGFRAIAANNEDYAGQEGPFWVSAADGTWTDIPPDGAVYAAKVGIKHKSGNVTWGIAKFKDYAAGPMWTKFPSTMIAKCAEMLALRKAMPEALGGLYGTEEMAQADKKKVENNATPGPAAGNPDVFNGYSAALTQAGTLEVVREIGTKIMADQGLTAADRAQLHQAFTAAKARVNV